MKKYARTVDLGRLTAGFLLFTTLFAVIYTQSPLYTSNQNQYFLHGLARAGYGELSHDWLANTLDPTPLFSLLVEWTYRLTHFPPLFYIDYALLMGVYLFSALGIVESVFPLRSAPSQGLRGWLEPRPLAFLSLFLLVHSAAWRFFLSRILSDNWTYLLEDGVADQRLLGSVLQPSAFGVLLVLSIYLFLKDRPYWAVLCAALAATWHPTYLWGAAALTAAYLLQRLWQARPLSAAGFFKAVLPGFAALLWVLPILAYVYLNFGSTPPETTAQARQLTVEFRIPHHALLSWWFDATALVKIGLVLLALFLVRKTRLFWALGVPFVLALLLTLAATPSPLFGGSYFLALLFPWRVSIFLVPLSTALILAWLVRLTWERLIQPVQPPERRARRQRWISAASLALIAALLLVGLTRLALDFRRQAQLPDRPLMAYIAAHRASTDVYLTPVKMQDFRLGAGAAAYVDFKSIPYQDSDVLEWYRREQLAERFYKQADCSLLLNLAVQDGVTHVVLERQDFPDLCPGLRAVYEDEMYGVYRYLVR